MTNLKQVAYIVIQPTEECPRAASFEVVEHSGGFLVESQTSLDRDPLEYGLGHNVTMNVSITDSQAQAVLERWMKALYQHDRTRFVDVMRHLQEYAAKIDYLKELGHKNAEDHQLT